MDYFKNFYYLPLKDKFTFFKNLRKIVNKYGLQRDLYSFFLEFKEEAIRLDYNKVYELFRLSEKRLHIQKSLPREYLEEYYK